MVSGLVPCRTGPRASRGRVGLFRRRGLRSGSVSLYIRKRESRRVRPTIDRSSPSHDHKRVSPSPGRPISKLRRPWTRHREWLDEASVKPLRPLGYSRQGPGCARWYSTPRGDQFLSISPSDERTGCVSSWGKRSWTSGSRSWRTSWSVGEDGGDTARTRGGSSDRRDGRVEQKVVQS